MPRKSASGKKWGSAAQRRALARATVISARKRDAAAPDHVNVQRRAVAKKIGQQSVLARKNEAFAEKERTTPKVSIEIDKAVERTKLRSGNVEKLRGELQKITPAKPAPKKRVQVKTRSAEKRPSVDGPKAPMPAGFKVGDRVTGKGRNVHEVIGPTRHPDVVKLRDTKYNVTVDALVSEIKKVPTGKPQGRRAQRTKERDAVVANAVNEPSQAEYSKKLNKAQNRISPSETKRKRTSAKKANEMPISVGQNSGTWTSPKGSILTQVEKVNRGTLSKMYAAERAGTSLPQADSKTRRAFELGFAAPKAAKKAAPKAGKRVDALAELKKGPIGQTGRRINASNPYRVERETSFAKGIALKPITQKTPFEDRYTDPIPGTGGQVMGGGSVYKGTTYERGEKAPLFARNIKVGDIIAVRQSRQSAYNSPNIHTTVHSKRYEVVEVGEDARGLYFKVTQPGKQKKGKGGTHWRPESLDTTFGIQPGKPAAPSRVRADALAEIRKGAIPGLDTSGVDRELKRLVPGSNVHNGTRRRSEQIESQIAARGANPHLKRTLKTAKLDELHTIARHPWAQSHPQRSEARKAAGLPDDHVVIAAPRPKKRRRKT